MLTRLCFFVCVFAAATAGVLDTVETIPLGPARGGKHGLNCDVEDGAVSLATHRGRLVFPRAPASYAESDVAVTTSTPNTLSTETGGDVLLKLSRNLLSGLLLFSAHAECRLDSVEDGWDLGSTSIFGEVTREGPRHLRCRLPPMAGEGPYSLTVMVGARTEKVPLWYSTPLAVSLGEQPYFNVSQAELLVRTNATLSHDHLRLTVSGPNGGRMLQTKVPTVGQQVLPLSLTGLPAQLDTMLEVNLTHRGQLVASRRVRLVRVPERLPGSAAVDFKRRSLLVDGQPFFLISWFSTYLSFGLEATIKSLQDMARRGTNSVMIYNLVSKKSVVFEDREPPLPGAVLDAASMVGIKVQVYLLDIVLPLARGESTDWGPLERIVEELRHHPAVLSWYVADDDAGPKLPEVYNRIKAVDPHHLVVIAINNPGNAYSDRYQRGADVIMLEAYATTAGGTYSSMNKITRWPTEFMPSVICGRAWSEGDTGGISDAAISPQMFRSQVYNALAAGITGEMWFAYRNADGWNEPGIPLQDSAGAVARELLDLVPSVLSTANYDQATAMPPVVATALLQDGEVAPGTALRARAFRETSGCVNLLLANSMTEPIHALVNFSFGSPGVYDQTTKESTALVPLEKAAPPRRMIVRNGSLSEWLPSLGVQIFRFSGTGDCADSTLDQAAHYDNNILFNPSFERSLAYISAPDGWDCSMAPPPEGLPDSSCFADTHVSVHGRHSGRFVTGSNPFAFRIRPSYALPSPGTYEGSIWAKSMVPMELLAVCQLQGETEVETEVATLPLSTQWQQLRFEIELSREAALIFKVSRPGVLWLDQATLSRLLPPAGGQ